MSSPVGKDTIGDARVANTVIDPLPLHHTPNTIWWILGVAALAGGVNWFIQRSAADVPAMPDHDTVAQHAESAPASPPQAAATDPHPASSHDRRRALAAPARSPTPDAGAGDSAESRSLAAAIRAAGWAGAPGAYLTGSSGPDHIGLPAAMLWGGGGDDVLTGSILGEWFLFADDASLHTSIDGESGCGPADGPRHPMGTDIVEGFQSGRDKIVLAAWTFRDLASPVGGGLTAPNDFAVVATDADVARFGSTAYGATRPRIVYGRESGNLYYLGTARGLGLGPGGVFATIAGAPPLAASDFRVVAAVDVPKPYEDAPPDLLRRIRSVR